MSQGVRLDKEPKPSMAHTPSSQPNAFLSSLLTRRLLFFTGKGGVGKTTMAAAAALRAVREGKRVLLCEVGIGSAFETIFVSKGVDFAPVELEPNLWATLVKPRRSLVTFLTRFVKIKRIARALVSNRVARRFFDAAPAVLETVVLERIAWFLTAEKQKHGRFDLIIVDLPATGHAVSFLDVPRSMARLVRVGALAEHLSELADVLADQEQVELVLVTQPEEMPVRETIELWDQAKNRLEVRMNTIIINRVRTTHLPEEVRSALRETSGEDLSHPVLSAVHLAATWEDRDIGFIDLLRNEVPANFLEIPWLTDYTSERALVDQVANYLDALQE